MNKEEILNDDFIENEVPQPKSYKKLKIAIAITASLAIIATTTLLIGYFKFDWFKSEVYNIDAKISRNLYQVNYFTETKAIKTKTAFTSGVTEENNQFINTNFMVMQTDRKELENNDFLNTATLVILDAKVNVQNEQKEVTSFNIFDQSKVEEFESNPDGSKYPMAVFSFYENGTIAGIQLPNNMDLYNAHSIVELIENIIPKLTRNRKEDISNGLNVETKKDNSKRTIVEAQAPKQIDDFRGSRFAKTIERVIENEKLTKISSNSNVDLHTQKIDEELDFGLKDFFFEQKSDIISTGLTEGKEHSELLRRLAERFTFVNSKDLIESLNEKSKGETEQVLEEWEEDINAPDSKARKLGFNFSGTKTKTLKTFDVLGCHIEIKLKVGVENGKALCQIIIQTSHGSISFGNTGVYATYSRTWSTGDITIFTFAIPPVPWLSIALKACGTLTFTVKFDSTAHTRLLISLSGALNAMAEIKAGWDWAISVAVGAKGTIVSASINASLNSSNKFGLSSTFSAGKVAVYVQGKTLGFQIFYHDWTVFNGWSYTWNL